MSEDRAPGASTRPRAQHRARVVRAWWVGAALSCVAAVGFIVYAVRAATRASQPGGVAVTPPASTRLARGDSAPLGFRLARLGGGTPISLAALARDHVVVLNLFASWCPACAAELHAFATVARARAREVVFVGVDTNDTKPASALALLRHAGARYLVGVDTSSLAVAAAYGVENLPVTFFINARGRIVDEVLGAQTTASLSRRVAALVAGRRPN